MAFKGKCSCLEKAAVDEPIFVLRAQDRAAAKTIRQWAQTAANLGAPREKVMEAMDVALEMEAWAKLHETKVPD